MLRSNLPSQSDVRSGDIHRGQHSGHRTNSNGAGPWHFAVKTMLILYGIPGKRYPLLRSHRTLRANPACCPFGNLCLDSTGVYRES